MSRVLQAVSVVFMVVLLACDKPTDTETKSSVVEAVNNGDGNGDTNQIVDTFTIETDSLALVTLKKANPNSTLDWDLSTSMESWHGVKLDSVGRVKSLDCNGMHVDTLPKEIGNLTNLIQLFFCSNKLTSIPNEIGNLSNLTYLDLGDNSLPTVPKEIGKLTNLKTLFININSLTSLPIEMGNLINLECFYIQRGKMPQSELDKITLWGNYRTNWILTPQNP